MTMSKLVSKQLRLSLAALALASAITTFGPGIATARAGMEEDYSGPTCGGLGCLGGYVGCAWLTFPNGQHAQCFTYYP